MILDPSDVKPDGWLDDEPDMVPDPDASEPDDWDEEDDGEWEAPLVKNPKCATGCGEWVQKKIPNPEYKGKWSAPLIDNPDYVGEWSPRKIDNPNFYEDKHPARSLDPIGAVAIEILAGDDGITFDNIYLGSSPAAANKVKEETFDGKVAKEKAARDEAEKAKAKADREKYLDEGGVVGYAKYAYAEAAAFVGEHMYASIGVGGAIFVYFLWKILMGSMGESGDDMDAIHKKDDDVGGEDDDNDDDAEEEEEEDDDDDEEEEEEENPRSEGDAKNHPKKVFI